jgi:hypothetical protein
MGWTVDYNASFEHDAAGNPALGGFYQLGDSPPLAEPTSWTPDAALVWGPGQTNLFLCFTEPSAWSRYPWHIPASSLAFPDLAGRLADFEAHDVSTIPTGADGVARLAWHGAGPWEWGFTVDGVFQAAGDQGTAAVHGPGYRTGIDLLRYNLIDPATGLPFDYTVPHDFTLNLLYDDVPAYVYYEWTGRERTALADISDWYDLPAEYFRARNYPVGYPSDTPDYADYAPWSQPLVDVRPRDQPILPPGFTSADYGGLGPAEVLSRFVAKGTKYTVPAGVPLGDFIGTSTRELFLEIVSDPITLQPGPGVCSAGTIGQPFGGARFKGRIQLAQFSS